MSGIAGIIHFDGAPVDAAEVRGLTEAMAYRGPDGISHWHEGAAGFGHCMLRTTPEAASEAQPLRSDDERLVLVMDGTLDNPLELRRELERSGARLRTRCDAELVLRAYETWHSGCLEHIDGDFAFVVWDAQRKLAFCARDRAGSRRLHYHWNGRSFAFATDIHALLALAWVPNAPELGTVARLLAELGPSPDETLWKGVLRLPAAEHMHVSARGVAVRKYWSPDPDAILPCRNDGEFVEHYRHLLLDAVRRSSRSHAAVACDVSGGLDSSGIFAIAEHLRRRSELACPSVEGYTLDFSGIKGADELDYALEVGRFVSRPIHAIAPTFGSVDTYRVTSQRLREPAEAPNTWMWRGVAETAAASGCKVWLKGLGGDEWLGGLRAHCDAVAENDWHALGTLFRADFTDFGVRQALWNALRFGFLSCIRQTFVPDRSFGPTPPWLTEQLATEMRGSPFAAAPLAAARGRVGRRRLLRFLGGDKAFIHESLELQAATLGLEVRRPYWNRRLVEAAVATPEYLRRRGATNKWIMRQALAGLLPERVLHRTWKAEFSTVLHRDSNALEDAVDAALRRRPEWCRAADVRAYFTPHRGDGFAFRRWLLGWNLFVLDAVLPDPGTSGPAPASCHGVLGISPV